MLVTQGWSHQAGRRHVWAFMIVWDGTGQSVHVPSFQSLIQVAVYGIVFVGLGHLVGVTLRRAVGALWAEG